MWKQKFHIDEKKSICWCKRVNIGQLVKMIFSYHYLYTSLKFTYIQISKLCLVPAGAGHMIGCTVSHALLESCTPFHPLKNKGETPSIPVPSTYPT